MKPPELEPVSGFGISPGAVERLHKVFASLPGLERVWIFGSRAQGLQRANSDIDLAIDAPGLDAQGFTRIKHRIEDLGLVYRTDVVWLQDQHGELFSQELEAHRRLFWQGPVHAAT
jgi:predicted nucleotidyltransferase